MRPGIGRTDHAPQRMAGKMRLLEAGALADTLEVPDEVFETELAVRHGRRAMAPQVVAHHGEMLGQRRCHEPPDVSRRTDAVNEKEGRAGALNRVVAVDDAHSAALAAPPAAAKCGITSSAKDWMHSSVSLWLAPKLMFRMTRSMPASA